MTTAESLLAEYGVEIVAANVAPRPMQTRAPKTVERILRRYGEAHARLVLSLLAETDNNSAVLDEATIWAVSDLIRVLEKRAPAVIDRHFGDLLILFDILPVGDLHKVASYAYGVSRVRETLLGMLLERTFIRFGAGQLELFNDRMMIKEA